MFTSQSHDFEPFYRLRVETTKYVGIAIKHRFTRNMFKAPSPYNLWFVTLWWAKGINILACFFYLSVYRIETDRILFTIVNKWKQRHLYKRFNWNTSTRPTVQQWMNEAECSESSTDLKLQRNLSTFTHWATGSGTEYETSQWRSGGTKTLQIHHHIKLYRNHCFICIRII